MRLRLAIAALLVVVAGGVARAGDWPDGDKATGDWGGRRGWLEDHGLTIDLDYSAEVFTPTDPFAAAYRGNVDLVLTFDTSKLGLWPDGQLVVYGQHAHGDGVSDDLELLMPVSNLEAPEFTQVSELWLEQGLGERVRLRLGKQDANRDFGSPRFAGNFLQSSYGVLPTIPMPSFPASGMGAVVFLQPTAHLGVRGGVYEGAPQLESFAGHVLDDGAGVFGVGALVFEHDVADRPAGVHSIGAWAHSGQDRHGLFGVFDLLLFVAPGDHDDDRSVQVFVRGGWAPPSPGTVDLYAGGGLTAHGFVGTSTTFGLGAGYARTDLADETFLELFAKVRELRWFTLEPDAQLVFAAGGTHVVIGLRAKLKL